MKVLLFSLWLQGYITSLQTGLTLLEPEAKM